MVVPGWVVPWAPGDPVAARPAQGRQVLKGASSVLERERSRSWENASSAGTED